MSSLILSAAYNCYQCLGFRPDGDCLDKLVLGSGKRHGVFTSIEYTELYLYDELIFSINLAREAEGLNQFISNVLRITMREVFSNEKTSVQEIQGMMISSGYEVADVLLEQANIRPEHDNSWFINYANSRLNEYEPFFQASYNCLDPIPDRDFRLGFEPRDHPLLEYLGAVSDKFAEALGIDPGYPMLQELIHVRYTTFLKSSGVLANE